MKVLSLFDGISCGQVALHRAGFKPSLYMASEINKSAIRCTLSNFPDTVQLGDVINVRAMAEAGAFGVGQIDLLLGGSPCQGFSNADDGLNFLDPRSVLFFEFVRILRAIKPKRFLLENVKMRKEWQDIITSQLGVQPIFINSADFSAQNRQRLYWTDIDVAPWQPCGVTLSEIVGPDWWSDRAKSYLIDANYAKSSNWRRYFFKSSRQIVFKRGFTIPPMTIDSANFLMGFSPDQWRILSVAECERLQTLPIGYTRAIGTGEAYHGIGNGWTVDVIAHIFKGMHS